MGNALLQGSLELEGQPHPPAMMHALMLQGMGEPLHNFEAVRRSIAILCHPQGLQLSHNKVSVSTVGLIPEIRALVATCSAQLAVSLHATTDEVRDWIAPVNRR